jgi:hypothetical protein
MIGVLRDAVCRLQDGGLYFQNIVSKEVSLKPVR